MSRRGLISTARRTALTVTLFTVLVSPIAAPGADPKMDPATGEPPGAPVGCCCFPKADSTGGKAPVCKPLTEFDCKAECAELRDGRLPSGCTWKTGACPQ